MSDAPSTRLIRRILRVDHAGEHGAVAIYQAQIVGLGPRRPELQAWLSQTLGHELRHRTLFREAMLSRAAKPCRLLSVWRIGGWTLGRLTALMGPSA